MKMVVSWYLREKLQEHPMIFMGKSERCPVKIFPSTNSLTEAKQFRWDSFNLGKF